MTKREAMRLTHQENTLLSLGFSREEAESLRRISNRLHRWYEKECNGEIQRDETDGKPYWYNTHTGRKSPIPVRDDERGAEKRLAAIMAKHAPLTAYLQTDPRGAVLYIIRPGDVPEGKDVRGYYSRGICVY